MLPPREREGACWLPSGCGIAVTPMNEPCLMSESCALTMAVTRALSASVTLTERAVARLDHQRVAIDTLDGAANADRRRELTIAAMNAVTTGADNNFIASLPKHIRAGTVTLIENFAGQMAHGAQWFTLQASPDAMSA
jgi:hypothetical protein